MKFSNTLTINRGPADVFAYLSRFENLPLWNYAISGTSRIGAGPVGVGSRSTQVRTIPRRAVESFEVTASKPDRLLAIRGTLGPFQAESSYELEAVGDSTVLTNSMDLEPTGAMRLVAPLAGARVRGAVAANLSVLKELLENGAARP